MIIGIVNKKQFATVDANSGEQKTQSYNELIIEAPFLSRETFTLTPNKDKKVQSAPDFNINWSMNKKGEKYRRSRAGALWKKVDENGQEFYSGQIESPIFPNGSLNIAIFQVKIYENDNKNDITWTHEVSWKPFKQSASSLNTSSSNSIPEIEIIDEEEIPF